MRSLASGDVSRAWLVWSGAAEAALADAYRFSGGPIPSPGLVLGLGGASISSCATWWAVRFGRLVVMSPMMFMMLLASFYIVTPLLLPFLT